MFRCFSNLKQSILSLSPLKRSLHPCFSVSGYSSGVAGTVYKELLSLTCFPNESFNQLRNNTNTTLQWVN